MGTSLKFPAAKNLMIAEWEFNLAQENYEKELADLVSSLTAAKIGFSVYFIRDEIRVKVE